jgi:nucleoside-diphosphate-sugar epimerase
VDKQSTVLVIGGTGFIGRAICDAIRKLTPYKIRVLARRAVTVGDETVYGDLNDEGVLHRALTGVSAVVHSASYIGYDPKLCQRTNVDGTREVARIAQNFGVNRMIYISTTGVYGNGIHRGVRENEVLCEPVSVLSRSRLEAEKLVLEVGGTVVRPSLVYGPADRWVMPRWLQTLRAMDAMIDEGNARVSTIRVDHLGLLVAGLLVESEVRVDGSVFHACDRSAVSVSEVLMYSSAVLGFAVPKESISFLEGKKRVKAEGISEHQLSLLWQDHWYDTSKIHAIFGIQPRHEGFHLDNSATRWYKEFLHKWLPTS